MDDFLPINSIHCGDSKELLNRIASDSIACSVWSPPYHVGKKYETGVSYEEWQKLLQIIITEHYRILKPGAFLVINIADILCFKDEKMPKIMADNASRKKVAVTKEQILRAYAEHPGWNRYQIAELLGCSEQTVDRRMKGNNIRGGKYASQTRVKLVGGQIEEMALRAGLFLYDRRVWVKDAAWENSKWHTMSYRAVDEFEYLYFFWKPGTTKIDRNRLTRREWIEWGSRAVWNIASVRANNDHEAKFPIELPRRIIRLLTEPQDIVLDCFLGSGTTAIAAILEERNYIGIEKEKHYAELACKACAKTHENQKDNLLDRPLGDVDGTENPCLSQILLPTKPIHPIRIRVA